MSAATDGVLIYAFNNGHIDYFGQAVWCADRVNTYLDLPCTIVTDDASCRPCRHDVIMTQARSGGQRRFDGKGQGQARTWYNKNRAQSFELSPYQRTLVLDSDYIVASDQLRRVFHSGISVTAMKHVYDVTNRDQFLKFQTISPNRGLHHFWATVLYFDRSELARDFFDIVNMITTKYGHYARIYNMDTIPFRNDYAVSIALNTIYGHLETSIPVLPWKMANAFSDVNIEQLADCCFRLTYPVGETSRSIIVNDTDIHFMNKEALAAIICNQ